MGSKTKGAQTKARIIECAAELFFKNGYNATGINDILSITELPKGSFYFHFKSKKALAIEVNNYFEEKLKQWIIDASKNSDWEGFITSLVGYMIDGAEKGKYFGCPLTTIGQELAFYEPDIAKHYSNSLKKIVYVFSSILERSGMTKEKACEMAHTIFIMYEGYLVYFRISKDINVLRNMKKQLIECVHVCK